MAYPVEFVYDSESENSESAEDDYNAGELSSYYNEVISQNDISLENNQKSMELPYFSNFAMIKKN